MKQDNLRKQVKILKAIQGIQYYEFAEYLEIQRHSFYNWLRGCYELSNEKEKRLYEIIEDITDTNTL